jgi:hypothetical protein
MGVCVSYTKRAARTKCQNAAVDPKREQAASPSLADRLKKAIRKLMPPSGVAGERMKMSRPVRDNARSWESKVHGLASSQYGQVGAAKAAETDTDCRGE